MDERLARRQIYRAACEMEKAGFDECSRHANILLMLVGLVSKTGSAATAEKVRYLAERIIEGDYRA